jgi:hypothetical protein
MPSQALIAAITTDSLRATGLGCGRPSPALAAFLPKEHGSWSLVLEPLALGLLVAPSLAGGGLATAAFAGFLARRPLKAALAPEFSERRCAARQTVVMLSALAVAGLFETVVTAGWLPLWPLLLAAPLAGLFAWFDAQGDSRAAAAELSGSAAFALLPAALATLAGWPVPAALALAALALARSLPTILTVRAALRLRKGQPVRPGAPVLAALFACGVILLLVAGGHVPFIAAGGVALLLLRSVWFATALRPQWSGRAIGTSELILGLCYITLAAVAYHHPLSLIFVPTP